MTFKLSDIDASEKVFIVFRGTPQLEGDLDSAKYTAEDMCEDVGDSATIMLIPRASLEHALKAVNHGVVLHALGEDD
jgi:hypothetical protein